MKKILYLLLFGFVLASCEEHKDEKPATVTYLLYMVGQNDLSSFLTDNINDLKTGLERTDIRANILVYADIGTTPELYLIKKDEAGAVTKNTVKTYPDRYSVDPDVMREVINEVFTAYPAALRGVTFSSHANGSLYAQNTVAKRSFGHEGAAGYSMNITDICRALDGCPQFDLIMFDACLMANAETIYELKEHTHYFLATPNSTPAEGFPYDKVLPYILKMNADGLSQAARSYMEYFHSNDKKWDDFVAVSLTDVTRMDALALYMDSLFQQPAAQQRAALVNRNVLQQYESGFSLYDFGQWIDSVGAGNKYLPRVKEALNKAVIYKAHSDYSSVDDFGRFILPLTDGRFSGWNTYVPPLASNYSEFVQRQFFTTTKWYADTGLSRVSCYNRYEK